MRRLSPGKCGRRLLDCTVDRLRLVIGPAQEPLAKTSSTISAVDISGRFAEILGRLEHGEEITITRAGAAVAKLIPVPRTSAPEERRAAFEAMRKLLAQNTLDGLSIKDLINEGRR
ncbi:MAG: type II toxin-antitoxin system prevent-host-death family antitoxin [Pirellulales bacterium]|nr:type II toxin-antitoxin system prevent-host-death family antitoxin [Pirellulales bacterium]